MLRRAIHSFGLILLIGVSCRADLTLRYTVDVKMGSAMPAAVTDAMKQQMAAVLAKEKVLRIKGDKTLSGMGAITGIIDNGSGEITLLNPVTKQYARIPMADYVAAIQPSMPAAAQQAMARMQFDVQNRKTGQIGMVFGIRAEEKLMTMTISMDTPGSTAAAGPIARIEIHTWLASPDDLNRIPGLRQYADYAQRALGVFNSTDAIQKMFSQMPGLGEKMGAVTAELTKNAGNLTVKTDEIFYMPMMAKLAQVEADPNAPFMEMHMDLAGISTDAIDDSVFAVPSDYQAAPAADLIRALRPATPQIPKAIESSPSGLGLSATLPDLDPSAEISRVGGGVSAPAVISKREPGYTEEARIAKLSGGVLLSMVVDKDGFARNIRVVRPLGMGLDEKAIEAVSQWKFQPGQKDGQPVNVRATIEVNFKLLVRPPQQ
jgi:TonB family protein